MPPMPPGPAVFSSANLRGVIPGVLIAGRELALASVERYRDGFVATLAYDVPPPSILGINDRDDRGTSCRRFDWAGSGQRLRAGRSGWRLDLMFEPGILRESRLLRVRLGGATPRYSGNVPAASARHTATS